MLESSRACPHAPELDALHRFTRTSPPHQLDTPPRSSRQLPDKLPTTPKHSTALSHRLCSFACYPSRSGPRRNVGNSLREGSCETVGFGCAEHGTSAGRRALGSGSSPGRTLLQFRSSPSHAPSLLPRRPMLTEGGTAFAQWHARRTALLLGMAIELRTQPGGREREMALAENPGVLYGIRRARCVEVRKSVKHQGEPQWIVAQQHLQRDPDSPQTQHSPQPCEQGAAKLWACRSTRVLGRRTWNLGGEASSGFGESEL